MGSPQRQAASLRHQTLPPPVVGDLTFAFEAFDLAADTGQRMLVYTVEKGSASHDALNLLASWAATPAGRTIKGGGSS